MAITEDSLIPVWKINNLAFSVYGVFVAKSSGVLDLPSIVDVSNDWLDLNGRDYWQYHADTKFEDNNIILSCWVRGSSYSDFNSKVNSFLNDLSGAGTKILSTPYGNDIEVSVQDGIKVVQETNYLNTLQIGVFTVKFIVSGDSKTKLLTVYRADDVIQGVVKYGNDCKLTKVFQGETSITLTAEFNSIQTLGRSDYIMWREEKYISLEYPQFDKFSTNKFVYRLTYVHEFFVLKDIQFRMVDRSNTPLWATMEQIVDLIIDNANRGYAGRFVKGTVDASEYRNHQFNNESALEVLGRIANEYELEYQYITYGGQVQINVQSKIGYSTGIHFAYGKEDLLTKINRISSGREAMCTRLYAYGSTKNIPIDYGYPRLKLAVEPLTRNYFGMHIERTKEWEDIFPQRTAEVTGYTYIAETDPAKPETAKYIVADSTMFDLNQIVGGTSTYLISGTTAKVHFQTGNLAGFEFEVKSYDHASRSFTIIPIKEDNGKMYPNAEIYPEIGNQYILLDIKLPQEYIVAAEALLLEKANAWLDENYAPQPTYTVECNPKFSNDEFTVGDTVNMVDADCNVNGLMRITEVHANLYDRSATLTLTWTIQKPRLQKLELKVSNMERSIKAVSMDDVNTNRNNQKTTSELKNAILNPLDEKLNSEELVRKESLDPIMLAYDSGETQFSLEECVVVANAEADVNKIQISAGKLVHHNWREQAMSREEIVKYEELNGEGSYVPKREWTYGGQTIDLPTAAGYFLYAKIPVDPLVTTFIIEAKLNHVRVKRYFPDFLYYKLGYVNAVSANTGKRQSSMLWGNSYLAEDKTYHHVQLSPSRVWSISHNLKKLPSVTIKDFAGDEYEAQVSHTDENNLLLTFSEIFSGLADLN